MSEPLTSSISCCMHNAQTTSSIEGRHPASEVHTWEIGCDTRYPGKVTCSRTDFDTSRKQRRPNSSQKAKIISYTRMQVRPHPHT